jgi:hypothetical protein
MRRGSYLASCCPVCMREHARYKRNRKDADTAVAKPLFVMLRPSQKKSKPVMLPTTDTQQAASLSFAGVESGMI